MLTRSGLDKKSQGFTLVGCWVLGAWSFLFVALHLLLILFDFT